MVILTVLAAAVAWMTDLQLGRSEGLWSSKPSLPHQMLWTQSERTNDKSSRVRFEQEKNVSMGLQTSLCPARPLFGLYTMLYHSNSIDQPSLARILEMVSMSNPVTLTHARHPRLASTKSGIHLLY